MKNVYYELRETEMRDLIVYYSLERNTEYVVDRIKEKTGADTLRLVPKRAYSNLQNN